MRIESSVTSISWIPRDAVEGLAGVAFDVGLAHYDSPPPPVLEDLDAMRKADRFRFANELRGWVEVVDGGIVDHGHLGQGYLGSTTLRIGPGSITFQAVALPDLRPTPEVSDTSVRLCRRLAGGRELRPPDTLIIRRMCGLHLRWPGRRWPLPSMPTGLRTTRWLALAHFHATGSMTSPGGRWQRVA